MIEQPHPLGWPAAQPRLTAAGVTLRAWEPSDADTVVDVCQDAEIQRWTRVPVPYLPEHAEEFTGSHAVDS